MPERKRNYGLDLLRMVSMFMIVNLHVLSQGGVMVRVTGREQAYYAAWFLETCAYCAVNCYGLISGYVGVDSKFRPSRIVELWLQVFFYSAGITLIYKIVAPDLLMEDSLFQAVFPVCFKTYWYFTAYSALFFLTPYLNRMIHSLARRELKRLSLVLFLIFSVVTAWPKILGSDMYVLLGGYSFVWLLVLYLLGACLKKADFRRFKKWQYLLTYFILVIFSWAFKILMENYTRSIYGEAKYGRLFTSYTAPTILLCAVCLFLIFESFEIKSKAMIKLIKLGSPLAFSVYLIHTQPLIWEYILKGAFKGYRTFPVWLELLAVLATAAAIYIVCSLIDLVRKQLFDLLRIRERIGRIVLFR